MGLPTVCGALRLSFFEVLIWEEDDSDVCSVTCEQQIPAEEEATIVLFMCVWHNGYKIEEYTCMALGLMLI